MLRRYRLADIDRIVELELQTLGTTLGAEMLKNEFNNSYSYYYVYEENNTIIGFISFSYDGDIAEMLNFCVAKNYQNKGFGSNILNAAIALLEANSVILEVRESNKQAIHVYEKLGFKQIHIRKNYYANGENALILQKIC